MEPTSFSVPDAGPEDLQAAFRVEAPKGRFARGTEGRSSLTTATTTTKALPFLNSTITSWLQQKQFGACSGSKSQLVL